MPDSGSVTHRGRHLSFSEPFTHKAVGGKGTVGWAAGAVLGHAVIISMGAHEM